MFGFLIMILARGLILVLVETADYSFHYFVLSFTEPGKEFVEGCMFSSSLNCEHIH